MTITPNKAKILVSGGVLLFIIGVFGFIYPYMPTKAPKDDAGLMASVQDVFEEEETSQSSQKMSSVPKDPELKNITNRLQIPSVGIDMPLLEGDEKDSLAKGGWFWPTGLLPSSNSGNVIIFGHRFRYKPPISNTMYALDKVNSGDDVIIKWEGKTYRYEARGQSIIEPTDLSVLNQTDEPLVTLITCTPLLSTKMRLVLTAVLREVK